MTNTRAIDERLADDAAAVKRHTNRARELHRRALMNAIDPEVLKLRLRHYEMTNDHDHGRGPIPSGVECPAATASSHAPGASSQRWKPHGRTRNDRPR